MRERGTLVGNAIASPPGAEAVAALALHGASLVVARSGREEAVPLGEPIGDDIAIALCLPRTPQGTCAGFFEVQRRFGHLGLVGAGVMVRPDGTWSAVLSGIVATALRAPAIADALAHRRLDERSLAEALSADLDGRVPCSDIHATSSFRREVTPAVIRRAVERLQTGIEGPVRLGLVYPLAAPPREVPRPPTPLRCSAMERTSPTVDIVDPRLVNLSIDGEAKVLAIEPTDTLAEALDLRIGCGEGVCGACTVALDGHAVRACVILAAQAEGCSVETVRSLDLIEGAPRDDDGLTPLQRHLREQQAFQCGWCTTGLLVGTACFLRGRKWVESHEIAMHLVGHLCRCLASAGVAEAIENVLRERRESAG